MCELPDLAKAAKEDFLFTLTVCAYGGRRHSDILKLG